MSEVSSINAEVAHRQPVRLLFGGLFVAVYLAALLPPIYVGMTKLHDVVLGLPISVWYMFLVSLSGVVLCGVLYAYELAREELD